MFFLLFYIFLYCNIDDILNKFYLSNFNDLVNNELIKTNEYFYYSVYNFNLFIFCFYFAFLIKNLFFYNSVNKYSILLALVYIKYTFNILLDKDMKLCEYEFSRYVMWLFSTPLMLKMYCKVNNIKITDINIYSHIIPTIINIFVYPFVNTPIHKYINFICFLLIFNFVKTLYKCKGIMFKHIFLIIWSIFIVINTIEKSGIFDKYIINLFYLYGDMIGKIITNVIINDYYSKEVNIKNNMDLQSINFISHIVEYINQYRKENSIISSKCNNLIEFVKERLITKIPDNKELLEKELLQKILPLGLEKEYIDKTKLYNEKKQFTMICVLFTDIVNYTELAHKYNDNIIFDLLNTIYITFDNIIKKYPHLQKIETIGDAYMVVGDIYSNTSNYKVVIKEIIELGLEFISNIKFIKTPDSKPLSIRIGINIGNVSIGILGKDIPRLCVVGDTVNMAARLQSNADIDSIQISKKIFEELDGIEFDSDIKFIKKDNVFLKNIGSVSTYNIFI